MTPRDIDKRKKAILGFLYANSLEPADKIHIMKEVFWLGSQIKDYADLLENYGAYDYGPDDQELEFDIEDLIAFGYVEPGDEKHKLYRLTSAGRELTKNLFSDKEIIAFETIKETLNKLNFEELLYLVYRKFPEFAANSKAKNVLGKERELLPRIISKGAISKSYAAQLLGISITELEKICKDRC